MTADDVADLEQEVIQLPASAYFLSILRCLATFFLLWLIEFWKYCEFFHVVCFRRISNPQRYKISRIIQKDWDFFFDWQNFFLPCLAYGVKK